MRLVVAGIRRLIHNLFILLNEHHPNEIVTHVQAASITLGATSLLKVNSAILPKRTPKGLKGPKPRSSTIHKSIAASGQQGIPADFNDFGDSENFKGLQKSSAVDDNDFFFTEDSKVDEFLWAPVGEQEQFDDYEYDDSYVSDEQFWSDTRPVAPELTGGSKLFELCSQIIVPNSTVEQALLQEFIPYLRQISETSPLDVSLLLGKIEETGEIDKFLRRFKPQTEDFRQLLQALVVPLAKSNLVLKSRYMTAVMRVADLRDIDTCKFLLDIFESVEGPELTVLKKLMGLQRHKISFARFMKKLPVWMRVRFLSWIRDQYIQSQPHDHLPQVTATSPLKLLSDIDDTLYTSIHDRSYPVRKTMYPGVLALHKAIDLGPGPNWSPKDRYWNSVRNFEVWMEEGDTGFLTAQPYMYGKMTRRSLASKGVDINTTTLISGTVQALRSHQTIADMKYQNFVNFQELYPEYRFIYIGSPHAHQTTLENHVCSKTSIINSRSLTPLAPQIQGLWAG